jgi:hypothetical protein
VNIIGVLISVIEISFRAIWFIPHYHVRISAAIWGLLSEEAHSPIKVP